MSEAILLVRRDGEGVAEVTLNRPEKRNALSIELREHLATAFDELSLDEEVGAIVLTGAGSAFCAGMDISQFGGDQAHKKRLVDSSTALFRAVARCSKPVVAAVNGPAIAGGFALALSCDLRLAGPDATFGFPELPRGIPPAYAAARATLTSAVARDLVLTGRLVDAPESLTLGIVSRVAADDHELHELSFAVAHRIAALPRGAVAETKRRILLERDTVWGALFADEESVFRRALLGGD